MKQRPFFSVIIPTYNREEFLVDTIKSVLSQSFEDFELILVDDGSTDATKKLIDSYADKRLCYVYQDNQGVASARNTGIKQAQADWIAFLDSDDEWYPQKLEVASSYIKKFSDIQFFHTQEKWMRLGKELKQKLHQQKPTGQVYQNILPLCCIGTSTAVINRSVFKDVGVFDESLPACEDYDFFLRATYQYEVQLIDEVLTQKNAGHADQLSFAHSLDKYRITALAKMLDSGVLSQKNYQLTYEQLQKKAKIFIQGAEKRGKICEIKECNRLVEKFLDDKTI